MAITTPTGATVKRKKYWHYFSSPESLLGTLAAVAIGLCLLGVAIISVTDSSDDGNTADCKTKIAATEPTSELKLVGVWPQQSMIGGHICIGVTGVISQQAETNNSKKVEEARIKIARLEGELTGLPNATAAEKQAFAKAEAELAATRKQLDDALALQGQGRTEPLTLFLNDVPAKGINPGAKPQTDDDTATIDARRTSQFQIIVVELRTSSDNGAELWGKVLRGTRLKAEEPPTGEALADRLKRSLTAWGAKTTYVGLGRGNASTPEVVGEQAVRIRVYYVPVLFAGIASLLLFGACLVLVARKTTLLRDSNLMEVPGNADFDDAMHRVTMALAALDKARQDADAAGVEAARVSGGMGLLTAAVDNAKAELNAATGNAVAEAAANIKVADAQNAVVALQTQIDVAQKTAGNLQAIAETQENAYLAAVQGLRDVAQQVVTRRPVGTFSLARTQIAMWIVLTLAGFLFIWLTTGQYNHLLTPEILVLLGIQAASTFTSIQLTKAAAVKDTRRTDGFFKDIIYDKDGPSLYRLQALAWTLVLAAIFIWGVFWDFSFAKFDSNLLLLTGIFNSMYLGFKYQAQQPSS